MAVVAVAIAEPDGPARQALDGEVPDLGIGKHVARLEGGDGTLSDLSDAGGHDLPSAIASTLDFIRNAPLLS
jgi:hypothetical protein